MDRNAGFLLLGALLGLGAGCAPGEAPGARSSRQGQPTIRAGNGLATADFVNALTGNRTALQVLQEGELGDARFSTGGKDELVQALRDPAARRLTHYLVGCALAPGQSLTWQDDATGGRETFEGQLGLCPSWAWGAPSQACLEQVTGCLLARNNALGVHVPLSSRGEDDEAPDAFALSEQVPALDYRRSAPDLTPVASLQRCAAPATGSGRNCGFSALSVGTCQPWESIHLGAGSPPDDDCGGAVLGKSSGRAVLRVCEGLGACDHEQRLAESAGTACGEAPALQFRCPPSGHFAVMAGPYDSSEAAEVQPEAAGSDPAHYPAPEAEVFGVREGAFFGNLFDPAALDPKVDVYFDKFGKLQGSQVLVSGAIFHRAFACSDVGWTTPEAYETHRLCARPDTGENCLAEQLGPCLSGAGKERVCLSGDGPRVEGDGDFFGCASPDGERFTAAYTTYLDEPCSVVTASSGACKRLP